MQLYVIVLLREVPSSHSYIKSPNNRYRVLLNKRTNYTIVKSNRNSSRYRFEPAVAFEIPFFGKFALVYRTLNSTQYSVPCRYVAFCLGQRLTLWRRHSLAHVRQSINNHRRLSVLSKYLPPYSMLMLNYTYIFFVAVCR